MLFTVVPNKLNYMLISTPCLLDLCQTWLLFISFLSAHRNNSLSFPVPRTVTRTVPLDLDWSKLHTWLSATDQIPTCKQNSLCLRYCLCTVYDMDWQSKPTLVSYCTIIVLPPSHKWRYFSSKKYPRALSWSKGVYYFGCQKSPFRSLHEDVCAQSRISSNSLPMKS